VVAGERMLVLVAAAAVADIFVNVDKRVVVCL
jgi:hypothetical protein